MCKFIMYPLAYQDIVTKYSNKNDLDTALVMAVIKSESNFVPDAHSGKACGLMQLTDDTAEFVAKRLDIDIKDIDLKDPSDSVMLGCNYLKYLIDYYDGNIDVALAAYNGGPGNVDKWLKDKDYSKDGENLSFIPFKETREYVVKVRNEEKVYKKMLEK